MNNYELLYILPSNMTGIEIKSAFSDIEKEILKMGGKKLETLLDHPFLSKTEMSKEEGSEELKNLPVVKRKLAYAIKKNRFGFYCLFSFSSEGNKLKEIDKYLEMNKNILRHFILQANPMSKEELALLQKLFARKKAEQEKESKKEEARTNKETEKEDDKKVLKTEEKKEEDAMPQEDTEKKDEVKKEETEKEIASQKIDKEKNDDKKEEKVKKKIAPQKTKKEEGKKEDEKEDKNKKVNKKKKIKLEDLEDKLDEILEDTMI